MSGFITIGISICITVAVVSLFSMLVPNSSMDKVLRFAISLFFLTGLLAPFFSTKLSFHIEAEMQKPQVHAQELARTMDEQFMGLAKTGLESSIRRMLSDNGIDVLKVQVSINKIANDNISISKLMVYIQKNSENDALTVSSLIQKEVGIAPQIIDVAAKETPGG